jgi:hypothetical protein
MGQFIKFDRTSLKLSNDRCLDGKVLQNNYTISLAFHRYIVECLDEKVLQKICYAYYTLE